MTDRYLEMTQTSWGKSLAALLGLPKPPRLQRGTGPWAERPLDSRGAVIGAGAGAQLVRPMVDALNAAGATLRIRSDLADGLDAIRSAAGALGVRLAGTPVTGETAEPSHAIVFDASGMAGPQQLRELFDFFQPLMARVPANARVLVLGRPSDRVVDAAAAAAARALLGFVKSLGKELGRKGTTVNLIEVAPGAEASLAGALRFFLSDHSAFVSGQAVEVTAAAAAPAAWAGSLGGKVALVTGAARGIGASIVQVLAREGAQVVGVDRPQEEGALGSTLSAVNGVGLPLDITAPDAGERIGRECGSRFGGLDIVVHNAGITRDKMLRNMPPHYWDQVLDVNLASIVRVNETLLGNGLKPGARMVCVSSIGGIAGNAGQTNYGATKAGVIGYVRALAPEMARRGGAVNAIAPGFIETQMTAAMPVGPRVVGRLMSSLMQGGLPVDIAEAVAFFASPYSGGVNGQTLRVCGLHMVGA